jgi:membrane-bound lytic murein transglycosylase A
VVLEAGMNKSLLALAAVAAFAGCASDNPASSVVISPATSPKTQDANPAPTAAASLPPQAPAQVPVQAPSSASVEPDAPASPQPPQPAPSPAAAPAPAVAAFATRHANYQAVRFADLPGWSTDDLSGSLDAFRRSCSVLGTRSGWSTPCTAARTLDTTSPAAIRHFFEAYFDVYQITNTDRSADGTMTGYYEPLLNGSKQYGGAYVYPVYGVPDDMLYLDARRLNGAAHGSVTAARIEGRAVIPLPDTTATATGAKGIYTLDLRDSVPDIRDKKIRLRLDGNRIVPYYTRAEIERGAARAPVIAWVDDPVLLYSMQMQGSGKIRMRDGTIRRVAYAEQNGRPFLPPIAHAGASGGHRLMVRGLDVDIDVTDEDAPADATSPPSADDAVAAANATASSDNGDDQPVSPLLRGFKLAAATPPNAGPVAPAMSGAPAAQAAPVAHGFATSDPSYVFFRPIPDSPNGPTGALGVPLSAGRSVAVDPRTTPLGSPVFVATREDPQTPGAVNRLMMAQDSGGAIQGAVRADYFYGFGQSAQSAASHTKEPLRMWLLLPKGLRVAAQESATQTRALAPPATADSLVADAQLCVDDDSP